MTPSERFSILIQVLGIKTLQAFLSSAPSINLNSTIYIYVYFNCYQWKVIQQYYNQSTRAMHPHILYIVILINNILKYEWRSNKLNLIMSRTTSMIRIKLKQFTHKLFPCFFNLLWTQNLSFLFLIELSITKYTSTSLHIASQQLTALNCSIARYIPAIVICRLLTSLMYHHHHHI